MLTWHFHGFGDLDSHPDARKASALLANAFPQPGLFCKGTNLVLKALPSC